MKWFKALSKVLWAVIAVLLMTAAFVERAETSVCTQPPSNRVSWWGGDNNALDMIGTNHGTLMNGATYAAGMVGQAFSFDGMDDYFEVPPSSSFDFGTGDFAIDAWIYPQAYTDQAIVSRWDGGNGNAWDLRLGWGGVGATDKLYFFFGDAPGSGILISDAVSLNQWHHVAVTRRNGVLYGYLDGVEYNAGLQGGNASNANARLAIGKFPGYGSPPFSGLIDEVGIFNRALTAEEIAAIYNAGSAGKCRVCTPPPSNIVSWWKGENNGNDSVGTNHGTLQNGATYAPGKVGQAFSFDGVDDYVEIPKVPTWNFGTNSFSITAWFKSNTTGHRNIVRYHDGASSGYWGVRFNPEGRIEFISDGGVIATDNVYADGNWHFVSAVRDGTNGKLKIFIDGNPAAADVSDGGANIIGGINHRLAIGAGLSGGGGLFEPFAGLIDEVTIYSRALTAEEIAAIYNAGSAGKCITLTVTKSGTGQGTVTSNPTGINCGVGGIACVAPYSAAATVTLSAEAATGSTFAGWSGDCAPCGSALSCQVITDASKACAAIFSRGALPATTWAKTYGGQGHEEARVIKQTADGGYIVAGHSTSFSSSGLGEPWVLKIDAKGAIQWQKVYKNTEKETYIVRAVEVTKDGGYIIAGEAWTCYESEGPLCQGYGWLLKIDTYGQVIWQRGYKTDGGYGAAFSSVQQAADGGYIAVGRGDTLGTVTARSKLWVVKVNDYGNVQWQRMLDYVVENVSVSDSYANTVQQTADGGYIVAGTVMSFVTGLTDAYDLWVLKLDGNGDLQWHKLYRGGILLVPAYNYDIAYAIRQTGDGGYIIAGQTEDAVGYGVDGLLLKIDHLGNIQWQKNYESGTGDAVQALELTADGGYIIGGLHQYGGILAKVKPDGTIDWQKDYKFSGFIASLKQTTDNGFVMLSTGGTSADYLVIKTDENGNINNCFDVENAKVQVYDAALRAETFNVTVTSPSVRVILTKTTAVETEATSSETCIFKQLKLSLSSPAFVQPDPKGLTCTGLNCQGWYRGGSQVAVYLNLDPGATFNEWGGDCSPCGTNAFCQLTMDTDKNCTAALTTLKGDIDGDGKVTIADAIISLRVLSGQTPPIRSNYPLSGVDVNEDEDGRIGLAEVIYILQKLAGLR